MAYPRASVAQVCSCSRRPAEPLDLQWEAVALNSGAGLVRDRDGLDVGPRCLRIAAVVRGRGCPSPGERT